MGLCAVELVPVITTKLVFKEISDSLKCFWNKIVSELTKGEQFGIKVF